MHYSTTKDTEYDGLHVDILKYSRRTTYFETYTATTKAAGIRTFASIVATHDLDTQHVDVDKFFPSHKLKETVYCEQMPGFVEGGTLPNGKNKLVCKLNMALEGLKQSGNTAQSDNVKHLTQICELNQCVHEPTIFIKTFPDKTEKVMLLLLIWIDDIWVAYTRGSKRTTYDPFISAYKKKYCIKEMGEIKLRDNGLTLNQAPQVLNHWKWLNTCYR